MSQFLVKIEQPMPVFGNQRPPRPGISGLYGPFKDKDAAKRFVVMLQDAELWLEQHVTRGPYKDEPRIDSFTVSYLQFESPDSKLAEFGSATADWQVYVEELESLKTKFEARAETEAKSE